MRIAIHCITLAIGVLLVGYAGISHTRPVAVWSDFKAFSARIAGDQAARHVLDFGGEKEGTDFDHLLDRVWGLSDDWKPVVWAGMLLCAVGVAGFAVETAKTRRKRCIELVDGEGLGSAGAPPSPSS